MPVHDTVDPTKVKCQGQGLGTNVRANIPQVFTVDASKAGVAPLQVRVQGPKGETVLPVTTLINYLKSPRIAFTIPWNMHFFCMCSV